MFGLHINLAIVLIGCLLIAVGIVLPRLLKRKDLVGSGSVASTRMTIGFETSPHVDGESVRTARPVEDALPEPTPTESANAPKSRKTATSLFSRLSSLAKLRSKPATPKTIAAMPNIFTVEPEQQPAPKAAKKPVVAKPVETKKSPLRFAAESPAALILPEAAAATPVDVDEEVVLFTPKPKPQPVIAPIEAVVVAVPEEIVLLDVPMVIPTDEDAVPVPTIASEAPPLMKIANEDDEESPISFSGSGSIDKLERERLLAEMDEELALLAETNAEPIASATTEQSDDDEVVEFVPKKAAVAPIISAPAAMIETFRWTTFMGDDAQALGQAERTNLIRLLRDMHDPAVCLPILMDAFSEEKSEALRPLVLEAVIHSYTNESLRQLYEYCDEHGSPAEKELASTALESLS